MCFVISTEHTTLSHCAVLMMKLVHRVGHGVDYIGALEDL